MSLFCLKSFLASLTLKIKSKCHVQYPKAMDDMVSASIDWIQPHIPFFIPENPRLVVAPGPLP